MSKTRTLESYTPVNKAGDTMTGALGFNGGGGSSPVIAKQTRFGYSSSYSVLQLGSEAAGQTVSLFVDPATNGSGSFNGNGKELLVPKDFTMLAPTASNTTFKDVLKFADGIVTTPYQPSFLIRKVTSESGSSAYNVPFTAIRDNIGNHYNTTTSTFTAPVTGRYMLYALTNVYRNGASYIAMQIWINGSPISGMSSLNYGFPSWAPLEQSCIVNLTANDSISVRLQGDGTFTVDNSGIFSGMLLG